MRQRRRILITLFRNLEIKEIRLRVLCKGTGESKGEGKYERSLQAG